MPIAQSVRMNKISNKLYFIFTEFNFEFQPRCSLSPINMFWTPVRLIDKVHGLGFGVKNYKTIIIFHKYIIVNYCSSADFNMK